MCTCCEYRLKVTTMTNTYNAFLFFFMMCLQTAGAHYYGMCVGTDTPAQTGPFCTDDNIYVYVNTNHGGLTGNCYRRAQQARVDVDTSPVYSRRPTVNNVMTQASLISIPTCSGPDASSSNTIWSVLIVPILSSV